MSSSTQPPLPVRANAPKQPGTPSSGGPSPPAAGGTPEADRKRKLIHSVHILKQATKEQHCSEDDLIQALVITTYTDGEYVYCQGQTERDVFFIEEGKVLITQRRAGTGPARVGARRRSVQEAELEIQIMAFEERECFGEMALLQNTYRKSNAVVSGSTTCMVLREEDFRNLLAPLHQLMLYRHLLRSHSVLEKHRLFEEFAPAQHQYLINHCHLEVFQDGEYICRQNETDDRYFILADGEANVTVDESITSSARLTHLPRDDRKKKTSTTAINGTMALDDFKREDTRSYKIQSSTVAQKSLFQGFGEMGLLDKPRTANVIARGNPVVCAVITRKNYIAASQLLNRVIDVDAEALLATTLIEEWTLAINARNLHLSNPHVAHYLITFIKKFKAAYNQKFVGKTMYLDFLRRLHQEPQIGEEFELISSRITWEAPSSSLSIIRSETRRILSSPPASRSPAEMSFVGRMIENAVFLNKFVMPPNVDRHKLARNLGKVMEFLNIGKDVYLFRQGKIESKAFLIVRGKINIVNEDVNSLQTVKHYEVIATLSAGDSFGELTLVARLQRSASAIAPCDTDLLVLDRDRLHMMMNTLPGVDVRHEMVERAEFLSRLDFFRGSDFSQCIRVAHDMQEVIYEPHHLFLKESVQLRTLYIVKSGEIGVFLKKIVPASSIPSLSTTSSTTSPHPAPLAGASTQTRAVLVRVATIGAQEFFGVAIAFANIAGTPGTVLHMSPGASATTPSVPSLHPTGGSGSTTQQHQHSHFSTSSQAELASTVYMCCTRVQVLELSERGWRRLTPQSLQLIRNSLLERNRWNHERAEAQKDPSYFHVDKPWMVLARSNPVTGKFDEPQYSQLVRHLRDKKQNATSAYALFRPNDDANKTPAADRCLAVRGAVLQCNGGSQSSPVGSPRQKQQQECQTKAQSLSPRPPALALPASSILGGSFSPFMKRMASPHPPSGCVKSPTRPSSPSSPTTSVSSPTQARSRGGYDFVRILAPIMSSPPTHTPAPSPGRQVRSSPGRGGGSIEEVESMWKLQRRPSLQ